jgi:hypothetical protein
MTALHLVNGHPTLIVLSCKDFHATSISVYTVGVENPESWTVRKGIHGIQPAPEQLTLLDAPVSWTTTENTLTSFSINTKYSVAAFGDTGHGYSPNPIQFTTVELAALSPGQVLVGDAASRRHAESESTFRADAHDACN